MATVPQNVILFWFGANASIPAGWSRETSLDSKFIAGAADGVNPGGTGGSATHTHTVIDHTHTQNSHTHSISLATHTPSLTGANTSGNVVTSHSHTASKSHTATNQNASVTLDAASSEPTYRTAIFVKSAGTHDVPAGVVGLFNSNTPPTGWYLCDGNNSTPDMNAKYVKGAAGSGDGNSTGGASTHTHTNTAHNHTQDSHGNAETANSNTGGSATYGSSVSNGSQVNHYHVVTLTGQTATNNTASVTINSANTEVVRRALAFVQNNTGGLKNSLIGVWIGTLASIPTHWYLCNGSNGTPDMRSYFVLGTTGATGGTGGNNGHNHTATAHTHTQNAHTHTVSVGSASGDTAKYTSSSLTRPATTGHSHTGTDGGATATNQDTTVTVATTTDTRPAFYEVAFIQYIEPVTLTIQDASHASTSDNATLTQHNVLSVADAAHVSTSDNVTVTAHNPAGVLLTVQDANHASSADEISLTQHNVLVVSDAGHALVSDNTDLVQHAVLIVSDAYHALTADNAVLVQHYTLQVDDSYHLVDSYIQVFPVIQFPERDTMLYYSGRGKEDYTVSQWYTDELCTEAESVLTTEDGTSIEADFYTDVLTKPIFLYYKERDYSITTER
jgi:hypothetical protein